MDHTPLFPPGIYDVTEEDLDNHFLSAFKESITRPKLIAGLHAFITALRRVGVVFEVWLDGSFCTDKLDPNDIDLVVFADENTINKLEPKVQIYLGGLLDRITSRAQFGCDVLFAPSNNIELRSYWRGWFGYDRNERPKGMAKLMVTP
jgi:hypothetical protein